MVREIGREENGLYILTGSTKVQQPQPQPQNSGCVLAVKDGHSDQMPTDVELWHKRLGHASIMSLNKLIVVKSECIANTLNKCTVCPHAKQVRSSFPTSSIQTSACFDTMKSY